MELYQRLRGLFKATTGLGPSEADSSPEGLGSLRKQYRAQLLLMGFEGSRTGQVSSFAQNELRQIETKIIQLIPDKFLQDFLKVCCENEFDIEEILEARDADDWEKPAREVCQDLVWVAKRDKEIPFSGKEIFSWLMDLAVSERGEEKSAVENVLDGFVEAKKKGVFCGKSMEELNWTESDFDDVATFTIFPVILAREYRKKFKLFAEVAAKIPGGREWVQKTIEAC